MNTHSSSNNWSYAEIFTMLTDRIKPILNLWTSRGSTRECPLFFVENTLVYELIEGRLVLEGVHIFGTLGS